MVNEAYGKIIADKGGTFVENNEYSSLTSSGVRVNMYLDSNNKIISSFASTTQ